MNQDRLDHDLKLREQPEQSIDMDEEEDHFSFDLQNGS